MEAISFNATDNIKQSRLFRILSRQMGQNLHPHISATPKLLAKLQRAFLFQKYTDKTPLEGTYTFLEHALYRFL
jgi:hypothetical protein